MISVILAAFLAPLMPQSGLELLPSPHLPRAGAGTIELTAIVAIAHVKSMTAEAADDFSKLFSHGRSTKSCEELAAERSVVRDRIRRRRRLVRIKTEGPGGNPGLRLCVPSMGAVLPVRIRPKGGHPDRSEPQLREGDRAWEGSGERSRGPMYKNRIRGAAERGEWAKHHEALMTKAEWRKSGGRTVKDSVLTWGGLALVLKGTRVHVRGARSQPRS